jgi:hypothetical protein
MIGISIQQPLGIGDALQFSSAPENYYHATGNKLYDVSKLWFFDHNPFITRELIKPLNKTIQMWNFGPKKWEWPRPRTEGIYLSNAEIWANVLGVKEIVLNRPRLYKFEDVAFKDREMILLHVDGRSHGIMPEHVVNHIIEKYLPTKNLYRIGVVNSEFFGNSLLKNIPHLQTKTLWDLAAIISRSRMLIGMDSAPAWIAACYPDVIVKKLRTKPTPEHFKNWIPLAIDNIHSHWDDRCHQIFNPSDQDIGFTWSYRKI